MTKLIEIKDRLIRFYGQYETYLFPLIRFVMAFALFMIINDKIGYMEMISTPAVAVVLALICCLLPSNYTLLFAAVVILVDMYALAVEVLAVTVILFVIIYLLYFRFAPKEGVAAVLTPLAFKAGVPFIMPLGTGLLREIHGILAVVFPTILYYYLAGIAQNESVFTAVIQEEDNEVSSKFGVAISQITENRELFLFLVISIAVSLIVYMIRRSRMDYAWTIAIIVGSILQVCAFLAGYFLMNISGRMVSVLVGGVVSMLIAFVVQFFCMNLDYGRVERVQFEDDEYYYYVKAVPKKLVASEEKVVKHFGNTANMGRHIERPRREETAEEAELSRKVIARELEIDEDLLK